MPDKKIDGIDILPVLKDPKAKLDRKYFFHYYGAGELHAVRDQRWKLHFEHQYRTLSGRQGGKNGIPVEYDYLNCEMALYDLDNDIGETTNVLNENPDVVARLKKAADVCRAELGDRHLNQKGDSVRPPGRVE